MSIRRRITRIIRANRSAKEVPADPMAVIETSQQQQFDAVDQARRSVADIAADCRRIELLLDEAKAERAYCDRQAEQCVARGDDDGAREALHRSITASKRVEALSRQYERMAGQWRRLDAELARLTTRIDESRMNYQALQARHNVAQATLGMQQAAAAAAGSASGMQSAARDAERETRRIEAEAAARNEIAWSDPRSAQVQEAFEWLEASSEVDGQLGELKARRNQPPLG